MKKNLLISLVLVGLIVISRLVPHLWNVAPVAAAALLAGAVLPRKWALAVPMLGMLASDLVIGFYHLPVMLTVYACFALMALAGQFIKLNQPLYWLTASLASSSLFFLATNFAVWAAADWYPKTGDGLILAYTLAIPFFRNTMLGDLFYTGILFGVWVIGQQLVSNKKVILAFLSSFTENRPDVTSGRMPGLRSRNGYFGGVGNASEDPAAVPAPASHAGGLAKEGVMKLRRIPPEKPRPLGQGASFNSVLNNNYNNQ